MKHKLIFLALILAFNSLSAQPSKKKINAHRATGTIKVDAVLDEPDWSQAETGGDYIQFEPYNGKPSKYKTEMKIIYTDYAIYIGAEMYDPHPDSIMKQLSKRDELGQTDYFGLSIDAFNDGLVSYTFVVTPGNVQFDARQSDYEDASWDAVWLSKTRIHDKGWTVEIEIPFSELRFPKKDVQVWGINFARNVQQTREQSFWSFVDAKIDGFLKQMGELDGITDIKPPVRLSFTPYIAGYIIDESGTSGLTTDLRGGLDLKYGINESYTLDMMLIPDFGQTESDDKELNISAYETYYDEKRPFFTEGTELFEKGEIFYSRRIGSVKNEWKEKDFNLKSHEEVSFTPNETSLINVSKISGKGKNGLGIGFLNGVAAPAQVTITDTLTGNTRKKEVQPYTNYNVLVFDQTLKNKSFVSLANTNYLQPEFNYLSNVTATHMHIENKDGAYAVESIFALSYVNDTNHTDSTGLKYDIEFGKISGNFRFKVENSLAAKKFNQNDLGYLDKTNEMATEINFAYNIYKPFGHFLKWFNSFDINQMTLYSKKAYIGTIARANSFTTLRNYLSINISSEFSLGEYNDFYEPRVDGRILKQPGYYNLGIYISPDYRKKFVLDVTGGIWQSYSDNRWGYWSGLMPIIRFSDHLNLNGGINFGVDLRDVGFVNKTDANDTIYFGRRDVRTLVNSLNVNYNFNANMALSLKARHYWRLVDYSEFYTLNKDGYLAGAPSYKSDDINSNFFNIDLVYTWRFAPGSELSFVWKNAIENSNADSQFNYFHDLNKLMDFDKQNSISISILYYIDYLKLRQKIRG